MLASNTSEVCLPAKAIKQLAGGSNQNCPRIKEGMVGSKPTVFNTSS